MGLSMPPMSVAVGEVYRDRRNGREIAVVSIHSSESPRVEAREGAEESTFPVWLTWSGQSWVMPPGYERVDEGW